MHILPTEAETKALWGWMIVQLFLPSALLSAGMEAFFNPAQLNFVYYLLNFLVVLWIFHRFLLQNLSAARKKLPALFRSAALGLLCFYLCNIGLSLAFRLVLPEFSNVNDAQIASLFSQGPGWMLVGTVVLAPLAEECFFRELIFHRMYLEQGWIAYPVSAAAFAAIHVLGYLGKASPMMLVLCFVQYLPAGLLLGWTYAKSGTLAAPLLMHSCINLISALPFL